MLRRSVFPVLATLLALPALSYAQPAERAAAPAAPASSAPATVSALQSFRRWSGDAGGPAWRAANDEMGRLAGHAGHLAGRSVTAPAAAGSEAQRAPAESGRGAPTHGGHEHGARK